MYSVYWKKKIARIFYIKNEGIVIVIFAANGNFVLNKNKKGLGECCWPGGIVDAEVDLEVALAVLKLQDRNLRRDELNVPADKVTKNKISVIMIKI